MVEAIYKNNTCYSGADPGFDQGGAPDRDRPKTAILGPQFCRILVLGPHFWWSGGPGPPVPPGSAPVTCVLKNTGKLVVNTGKIQARHRDLNPNVATLRKMQFIYNCEKKKSSRCKNDLEVESL